MTMLLTSLLVLIVIVGFSVGLLLGRQERFWAPYPRGLGARPVQWKERDDGEQLLFTMHDRSPLVFRGSGTVWHEWPSGRRATTEEEAQLADIAQRERWKREFSRRADKLSP